MIFIFVICQIIIAFGLVLMINWRADADADIIQCKHSFLFVRNIKQIDSMLLFICSAIDHRRHKVVKTSVIHSAITSCATFLLLSHFDGICDQLPNWLITTWNLVVKQTGVFWWKTKCSWNSFKSTCICIVHILPKWRISHDVIFHFSELFAQTVRLSI